MVKYPERMIISQCYKNIYSNINKMSWFRKLIDAIVRLLSRVAFKCKSDCCACQSECMGRPEEVQKQDIMDYVRKID